MSDTKNDREPHRREDIRSVERQDATKGDESRPVSRQGFDIVTKGSGFTPVSTIDPQHGSSPKRPKKRFVKQTLIPLLVIAAIVGGGILWWMNLRPVQVTVNGNLESVTIGTTVDQIVSDEGIQTTAGNYISVGGNVLAEGQGYPYSVTIDDQSMDYDSGSAYKVQGGEQLSITDGADRMEDYDSEVVEVAPKLTMDSDVGTINYISQWGYPTIKEVRTGKESGETADGEIYQQGQDCVISVRDVEPSDGRKLVALTFDDGPSEYTQQYLEILKEKGVKATFFCLGAKVEEYPDEAKAIVDAGCQICSHSYSHPDLRTSDQQTVLDQLTKSFSAIETATGAKTTTFRPPYGDFTQKTWLLTNGIATVAVRWNIDTEDWRQPGVDAIVSAATSSVKSGSIILMHDGGGDRSQDLEALPKIIDELQDEGYEFVTISELLQSDDSIPDDIANCDATMPDDAVWPSEIG